MKISRSSSRIALALLLLAPAAGAVPRRRANARAHHAATTAHRDRAQAGAQSRDAGTRAQGGNAAGASDAGAGAGATDAGDPAQNVVAQIQAFYDRSQDFEADFVQVTRNRLTQQETRREGHVRFKKPGRMRWDYANPAGDVIVSDGTTLWAYEAAAHQAFQSNLADSQLPSALSFLTGTGRLADDFSFRLLDAQRYRYPNGYVLELTPRTETASVQKILFYVDGGSYQVARTVVFDAQGNTNRFDFNNPQVNMNPAASVFQWTPPAGTQIVRP